jgi:hypothetical protein
VSERRRFAFDFSPADNFVKPMAYTCSFIAHYDPGSDCACLLRINCSSGIHNFGITLRVHQGSEKSSWSVLKKGESKKK